ncbi:MAG: DUF397 domain-containing protein [Dehalococcoidia bacterium]
MINLAGAQWRKSSRSNGQANCVEVAALGGARWRKSTRSNGQGNCVEVAANLPGLVAVRDSKHPDGPALTVAPAEWSAFLTGIEQGRFDL